MAQSQRDQRLPVRRAPLLVVLMSGAFVVILNQTLLATALPHIMADLHLKPSVAQWLISIFMLVNGITIPISAFLMERYTTRSLFLSAMGFFLMGTLICALAPNFFILLTGRVLQALGAGITMPLIQTVLLLIYPMEKRGSAMGMFGLVISFAPAIGPSLSGWMVDHFPWRTLFHVMLPIVLIDLILAYFILRNVTKQTDPQVDLLSIVLSSLGFGGLLYGFSMAGSSGDWTDRQVIWSILIGLVTLVWFIWRQLRLAQPILEFRIFKYPIFSLTTVIGIIIFLSLMGTVTILPLFTQTMLNYTALESGLVLLPGALIMGLLNPVVGHLFDRYGARWLSIGGLALMTVTSFMLAQLSAATSFLYLAVVHAFRMLGFVMAMMPVTTAGLNQLPKRLLPHGTALSNTLRQSSAAIGTALLVTIMSLSARPELGLSGEIHGVNMSFLTAGCLALIGFILTLFVKDPEPQDHSSH